MDLHQFSPSQIGAVVVFGVILWEYRSIHASPIVPLLVRECVYPALVLVGAGLLWRGDSVTRSWVSGGLIAMGAVKIGELLTNLWQVWSGPRPDNFGWVLWGQFAMLFIGVSLTIVGGILGLRQLNQASVSTPDPLSQPPAPPN